MADIRSAAVVSVRPSCTEDLGEHSGRLQEETLIIVSHSSVAGLLATVLHRTESQKTERNGPNESEHESPGARNHKLAAARVFPVGHSQSPTLKRSNGTNARNLEHPCRKSTSDRQRQQRNTIPGFSQPTPRVMWPNTECFDVA